MLPDLDIWLGGPEVSYDPEKISMQNDFIKGILIGEGEETFKEICKYYVHRNIELEDIKGLYINDKIKSYKTETRNPIDMDKLIFPYKNIEEFENRIIYYETSRGCPFSCSYCLSSIDKNLRFKNLEIVEEELKFFLEKKVKQVKFVDRTFNCNKAHANQIIKYIIKNDNNYTNFHFEISADLIDEKQLEFLKEAREGLIQFETGVQSTNKKPLQEIKRYTDFDKISQVTKNINEIGNIHQHLDLIAGLPYESYLDFKKSFEDVYALKPDDLQLGFLKVLKGSLIYENIEEYGIVYDLNPPYEVLYTKWINYEEILKLKEIEEALETYYNSGNFEFSINYLETKFDSSFIMYEKLGNFFGEKNLFTKHSRINNYNLLLEFFTYIFPEEKQKFAELLTHDIYIKEKIKSRPPFSKDLKKYSEKIRENYAKLFEEGFFKNYAGYSLKQIINMTHMEIYKENILNNNKEIFVLYDYKNGRTYSDEIS